MITENNPNFVIDLDQLRLWIIALRSGEYPQTTGCLQSSSGFCCLGVACKVLISKDELKYNTHYGSQDLIAGGDPMSQNSAPKWLRLINDDFKQKHGVSLITLNDEDNLTFNEIADLLEKTYLPNGN